MGLDSLTYEAQVEAMFLSLVLALQLSKFGKGHRREAGGTQSQGDCVKPQIAAALLLLTYT